MLFLHVFSRKIAGEIRPRKEQFIEVIAKAEDGFIALCDNDCPSPKFVVWIFSSFVYDRNRCDEVVHVKIRGKLAEKSSL